MSRSTYRTSARCLQEFADWLGIDLSYQHFEQELADLPGSYASPNGALFIAEVEEQMAGCVALRSLEGMTCEMKRLYVRPAFHGQGIGRRLAEAIIEAGRERGYDRMVLTRHDGADADGTGALCLPRIPRNRAVLRQSAQRRALHGVCVSGGGAINALTASFEIPAGSARLWQHLHVSRVLNQQSARYNLPFQRGDRMHTFYKQFCMALVMTAFLIGCADRQVSQAPIEESESDGMVASEAPLRDMAAPPASVYHERKIQPAFNTEDYSAITENAFKWAKENPLSTFSIDVDAASYSNLRRIIREGRVPPKDAVRIEEMVNYFVYDYPAPKGDQPFSVITEVGTAPWNPQHRLVHIGLQGKPIPEDERPASNLVFLLDVSGSMNSPDKLPLLKKAFRMLTDELTAQDRVAITVYAGAAGVVLPSTPGDEKDTILESLNRLEAGGSTAGAAGIQLAYDLAQKHFIKGGNNRVILATDGDFNVGQSSDGELVRLIEEKREGGTFLTVLGFGTGNIKDNKMEQLANKGNGNYYYIDGPLEAKKVLVSELGSTLFTIAKDVKIQVEFNPAQVAAYRLIGYENRLLANEDFNDDTKDAGELGAGHTVTAMYEIVPVGVESSALIGDVDDLKYQDNNLTAAADASGELMTVKLRYKAPDGDTSKLIERPIAVPSGDAVIGGNNFYFSAAVAAFGMILRDSKYKGTATLDQVMALARDAQGSDSEGYRAEFIRLVGDYKDIVGSGAEPTASR